MTAAGAPARPAPVQPPPEIREFVTPEGVDLRLRIGGAGERAAAFILDAVFLLIAVIALTFLAIAAGGALAGLGAVGVKNNLSSVMLIVWLLGFFLLRNGYFVLFEFTPRAATPGKRILGLRVAARDGGRLTAEAIFARNAMREIEVFLPLTFLLASGVGATDPIGGGLVLLGLIWTGGFALFPLFNRDHLRIGDVVAGTWVVKSPRERLSIDLLDAQEAAAGLFGFSAEQAGAYGIKELYVLEDVLRRKDPKTMAAVAERIRTKIGWRREAAEADEAFLAAYYGALRGRLETRLLFGHRRRDKFDAA
jgi:uncharacterized RDD family membrane protein YckC